MKNKPEWLDAALNGHPLVLRDGSKAYVRHHEKEHDVRHPLIGGKILGRKTFKVTSWDCEGFFYNSEDEDCDDIIGLWQEPEPVFEYWHLLKEDYVAIAMDKDGLGALIHGMCRMLASATVYGCLMAQTVILLVIFSPRAFYQLYPTGDSL